MLTLRFPLDRRDLDGKDLQEHMPSPSKSSVAKSIKIEFLVTIYWPMGEPKPTPVPLFSLSLSLSLSLPLSFFSRVSGPSLRFISLEALLCLAL